jgi:hypothetical protein
MSKPIAIVCAVLNFLLPGSGTWLSACQAEKVSKAQLCIGTTQFLLTIFFIGWIWAQYWSFLMIKESFK